MVFHLFGLFGFWVKILIFWEVGCCYAKMREVGAKLREVFYLNKYSAPLRLSF